MSSPYAISGAEFQELIRRGEVRAGDGILFRYRRATPLAWAIARVQRRALWDLIRSPRCGLDLEEWDALADDEGDPVDMIPWAARYTHAGMVVDAEICVEMTAPRARLIHWQDRLAGVGSVCVVRPMIGGEEWGRPELARQQAAAAVRMVRLAYDRTPYPWRELLMYWFSSLPGAISAPHFVEHFLDRRRNVCSGAVWQAWIDAGCQPFLQPDSGDAMPEAWYPARMAFDARVTGRWIGLVGEWEMGGEASGGRWTPALRIPEGMGDQAESGQGEEQGEEGEWAGFVATSAGDGDGATFASKDVLQSAGSTKRGAA